VSTPSSRRRYENLGGRGRRRKRRRSTLDEVGERLVDVGGVLGRGLDEEHVFSGSHLLSLLHAHAALHVSRVRPCFFKRKKEETSSREKRVESKLGPETYVVGQIELVADECDHHVLGAVLVDLLEPLGDGVERFPGRDVVHHQRALGSTIVRAAEGTVAFLAG
jgi:hypothetical protein